MNRNDELERSIRVEAKTAALLDAISFPYGSHAYDVELVAEVVSAVEQVMMVHNLPIYY